MSRQPFQVLVFPYLVSDDGSLRVAIFRRREEAGGYCQGIAGGGEGDETPLAAAIREAGEEAGIGSDSSFRRLETVTSIPVFNFEAPHLADGHFVIPEFSFAVEAGSNDIRLSREHLAFDWVTPEIAIDRLKWDSNRTAVWELAERLKRGVWPDEQI